MGIDIHWWFCKIEETNFSILRSEFDRAAEGVPDLPDVPELAPRPKTTPVPVTKDYAISVFTSILAGRDLSWNFYHKAFDTLWDRILQEEFFPSDSERFVEIVMQSRVAPPAILLMGIDRERFSRLPGDLGNMHSSEVEQTIESVSRIVDVDWESYFERAKLGLAYTGFDEQAAKDVSNVFHALPRALEKVKKEGLSLLAITSWG